MKKIVYNIDNQPLWITLACQLFYLNPCFPFGKIFADFTNVTNAQFDPFNFNWVLTSRQFTFADLWTEQNGMFFSKERYRVPCLAYTSIAFILEIILYITLTWYFDNIIQANKGDPQPWNFPIKISFWFPSFFDKECETIDFQKEYVRKGKLNLQE